MLSLANVGSAGGASDYFAKDNYYAKEDADRSGKWVGEGAKRLGLESRVEAAQFEAILRGRLPDGSHIGREGMPHRPGTDLTFSMPKSWSMLTLVGEDKRIVEAYRKSVIETLGWAEKNAAMMRVERGGKERQIATDNLTIAMFQHDTNRNQEPNVHFHAIVTNMTQGRDGKWKALRNDKLWQYNTLLNSMTMARFRLEVEKLGYEIGAIGKHGNFEASGISREQVMAFSSRRQEVLDARRGPGLKAGTIATLATRTPKETIKDRDALTANWREIESAVGLNLGSIIAAAKERSIALQKERERGANGAPSLWQKGRQWLQEFAQKIGAREADPLIPPRIHMKPREDIAAAHAVASAVRHLSEREAAFKETDLAKAALDFGLPTSMDRIEKRIGQLKQKGALMKGRGREKEFLTTADAVALENRILAEVDKGRSAVKPVVEADKAGDQLQAVAQLGYGMTLNKGQDAAGRLILSSTNRIVAVQGVAGAGKSSLLKPATQILREQGKEVLGLAVQNTLVQMLERDTGIKSMTLYRFLGQYKKLLDGSGNQKMLSEARKALKDHVLLLDEASMVSNADKDKLVRLSNLLEVDRLVMMGDQKQLGAVDAGKPFALIQKAGINTATMDENLRARNETIKQAQEAAQKGHVRDAMKHLKDHIVEVKEDSAIVAAEKWLALPPQDRAATSLYASGRRLRSEINQAVQTGLKANGELGSNVFQANILVRVNATREELRYLQNYRPGMVMNFAKRVPRQKIVRGQYEVAETNRDKGEIHLRDRHGKLRKFMPSKIRAHGSNQAIQLFEKREADLHEKDRIRWTANDHTRGLLNADQATITGIDKESITVKTSAGVEHKLDKHDPMLKRLDLAYALNAHMAQGLTSDRGIAVMDSRETKLANQQTFLVTITRLRDRLTLIVDNRDRLEAGIARNEGSKTSALEVTQRLGKAAAKGLDKENEAKQPEQKENKREIAKEYALNYDMSL